MKTLIAIGCVTIAGLCAMPAGHEASGASAELMRSEHAVVPTLVQIEELRRLELVKQEDSYSNFDPPGLELTFHVDLPPGQQLLEIAQPTQIVAMDSSGADLTKIEKSFMDELEYVELVPSFGEPPDKFTLKLAPPPRGSLTVSCNAQLMVTTYRDVQSVTLTLGEKLESVDSTLLDGHVVKARIAKGGLWGGDDEKGVSVTFASGDIRSAIEDIFLVKNGKEIESNSSMWSGDTVSYSFESSYDPDCQVRVLLRTGIHELPMAIKLDKQILP